MPTETTYYVPSVPPFDSVGRVSELEARLKPKIVDVVRPATAREFEAIQCNEIAFIDVAIRNEILPLEGP